MKLTRDDVLAIAACVRACNDATDRVEGVLDYHVEQLRALWVFVGKGGLALPEVSATAGGERLGAGAKTTSRPDEAGHPSATKSAALDPVSPPAAAGLTYVEIEAFDRPEPGAPDTVVVDETEAFAIAGRPLAVATTDAIVSGGRGLEEPTPEQKHRKRLRRTRAVGE